MQIKNLCDACKMTKKAVEYYAEKGLIHPRTLENGYRNFGEEDLESLKKIKVLRRLGLSVQSIKEVLTAADEQRALRTFLNIEELERKIEGEKQELLQELAAKKDYEAVSLRLDGLEQKETILRRLLNAFPGSYGKYLCLHFARYLKEPIQNREQEEAFQRILGFLDAVQFSLSPDLQEYFEMVTGNFDESFVESLEKNMEAAVDDPKSYLESNREILETYAQWKRSEDFQNSPAGRLYAQLEKLNREQGYDTVFIPAMKILSPSYRRYQEELKKADCIFRERYPEFS